MDESLLLRLPCTLFKHGYPGAFYNTFRGKTAFIRTLYALISHRLCLYAKLLELHSSSYYSLTTRFFDLDTSNDRSSITRRGVNE